MFQCLSQSLRLAIACASIEHAEHFTDSTAASAIKVIASLSFNRTLFGFCIDDLGLFNKSLQLEEGTSSYDGSWSKRLS